MMHIGDQEFYEEVLSRVSNCDVVMVEGVKSMTSTIITTSYRYVVRNPKLGLVLQPKIKPEDITGKIVHADVSARDFERKWSGLPIFTKLQVYTIAPLYGLYLRYFATRESIAHRSNTEYSVSRRDLLQDEEWDEFDEVLVDWRDRKLIEKLGEEIKKSKLSRKNIAIVFGAEHMRAVVKFLFDTKDYSVESSEWLTIIKF